MTRNEIYTELHKEVSGYRSGWPKGFRRSIGDWLLRMHVAHGASLSRLIQESHDSGYHYFSRLLTMAIMCMDDNGVVSCGCTTPMERITRTDDSDLDHVILTTDRGCERQVPGNQKDYAVRIDCYLRKAFEAHAVIDGALALDYIRTIASLAVLGIENKPLGEWNGKVD